MNRRGEWLRFLPAQCLVPALASCSPPSIEGDLCQKATDCAEGLWCLGGICQKAPPRVAEGDGGAGDAGPNACVGDIGLNEMVDVPAGPFWMGCNDAVDEQCIHEWADNEKPYHLVTLSAFKIDKYAVTVGRYFECVAAGVWTHHFDDGQCIVDYAKRGVLPERFRNATNPMVCVDWWQAKAYCAWAGKRLPTEAEREKAARGVDGRKYPWGNGSTPTCVFAVVNDPGSGGQGCGADATMPVGCKPLGVSPFGAYDMIGNVYEWVEDWYLGGYYKESPAVDPKGPAFGDAPVMRGGSWVYADDRSLRASARWVSDPENSYDSGGFRCVQ